MPSVTTTLGWTLANWGPGSTAFEASASCTQSALYYADEDSPEVVLAFESCLPSTTLDCYPEPTETSLLDDYYENWRNVPYWSPAPNCPSGWESVGQAARSGSSAPVSTGIFTIQHDGRDWFDDLDDNDNDDDDDDDDIVFGSQDALGALLDPSETVVACCPSAYTVGRNAICYSTLSTYSISTACYELYRPTGDYYDVVSTTYIIDGTTRTGDVLIPTRTGRLTPTSSTTRTLNDFETPRLVAATTLGPIFYVHRPGDTDNNDSSSDSDSGSSTSGSSTDSSETGSSSETGTDGETNAAAVVRPGRGVDWGQLSGVGGVLAVSLLAGMALVLPW